MQNTLPVWKLAETQWGLGQDRRDDPVPVKKSFTSLSTIRVPRWESCGVNEHKGDVSTQRKLGDPCLKEGAGHNSAYIHPAQTFELLESGVWDFLRGNGKSASAWDGSTKQASKLSRQVGDWEHPLPPRATGVWWLIQTSLVSGRSSVDHAVLSFACLCCTKLQTVPVQFLANLASP